jgi:hypothetical protein
MNRNFSKKKYDLDRKIASKFGSKLNFSSGGKSQTMQEQCVFDSRFDGEREQRRSISQKRCDDIFLNEDNIPEESQKLGFGYSDTSKYEESNVKCILRSKFANESAVSSQMNQGSFCDLIIKERAAEMVEINEKMHKVNDIYKDLATLISDQQVLIDNIDKNIDDANAYTKDGVEQIDEARQAYENPILVDPFGDKLTPRDRKNKQKQAFASRQDRESFIFSEPFAKFQEDMKVIMHDIKAVLLTCVEPNI